MDWKKELKENWRKGIDGKFQTILFAMNSLSNLNPRQMERIEKANNILDFGCALGGASKIFKAFNEKIVYTGYDKYSKELALKEVQKDIFTDIKPNCLDYDIVYSSQNLCYGDITKLSDLEAKEMLIILEPYDQNFDGYPDETEKQNPGGHDTGLSRVDFPKKLGNLTRTTFKCIPYTSKDLNDCNMILVVYEKLDSKTLYDIDYDRTERNNRYEYLEKRQEI
jgi:hypothetical protein